MTDKKQDFIDQKLQDLNNDGIDRRGFLKCMAWAGTGLVWTMSGGVPMSRAFAKSMDRHAHKGDFSFVQISDSHMGFNKPANPDVVATLQAAVDKINGLAQPPEFLLHTGDISHLSKQEQFDNVDQILKSASAKDVFFVPGEHDVLDDNGKSYLERYGKSAQGLGLVQLRQERRALHRSGERDEPQGRWTRLARRRTARMDGEGRQAPEAQHADRGIRTHPPVVGVSGLGLGHAGQRAGAGLPEEVRFGDGAERPHPPDHAEGRRKRDLSYRNVNRVSSTAAGQGGFSRTDESAGGTVEERARNY